MRQLTGDHVSKCNRSIDQIMVVLKINFKSRLITLGQTKLFHNPLRPPTIHDHPPPSKIYPLPPTTSQNMSTTTHHQQKYIHHHPPSVKIYPPLPTISQKMDHHPPKTKIHSYINSFRHCFNSFFFFERKYSFP